MWPFNVHTTEAKTSPTRARLLHTVLEQQQIFNCCLTVILHNPQSMCCHTQSSGSVFCICCLTTVQTSTVKCDNTHRATDCAIMSKLFFQLRLSNVRWQSTDEDLLSTVLHVLSSLTHTHTVRHTITPNQQSSIQDWYGLQRNTQLMDMARKKSVWRRQKEWTIRAASYWTVSSLRPHTIILYTHMPLQGRNFRVQVRSVLIFTVSVLAELWSLLNFQSQNL